MIEIRDPESLMDNNELVDTVNKVIELVGMYSNLCVDSRQAMLIDFDLYDVLNKKASETYRDMLAALYNIANTYTINGRREYFPVREMRRRKDNE